MAQANKALDELINTKQQQLNHLKTERLLAQLRSRPHQDKFVAENFSVGQQPDWDFSSTSPGFSWLGDSSTRQNSLKLGVADYAKPDLIR